AQRAVTAPRPQQRIVRRLCYSLASTRSTARAPVRWSEWVGACPRRSGEDHRTGLRRLPPSADLDQSRKGCSDDHPPLFPVARRGPEFRNSLVPPFQIQIPALLDEVGRRHLERELFAKDRQHLGRGNDLEALVVTRVREGRVLGQTVEEGYHRFDHRIVGVAESGIVIEVPRTPHAHERPLPSPNASLSSGPENPPAFYLDNPGASAGADCSAWLPPHGITLPRSSECSGLVHPKKSL